MHGKMNLLGLVTVALVLGAVSLGATKDTPASKPGEKQVAKSAEFELTSSAFKQGAYIPTKYTGDGANASPPLKWTGTPDAAKVSP